jgi:hypothetical protein
VSLGGSSGYPLDQPHPYTLRNPDHESPADANQVSAQPIERTMTRTFGSGMLFSNMGRPSTWGATETGKLALPHSQEVVRFYLEGSAEIPAGASAWGFPVSAASWPARVAART